MNKVRKSNGEDIVSFQTFTGEYEHVLDPQRRIAIPTCWRQKGEDNVFYLLPGRHDALQLIPAVAFQELIQKARKTSFADPSAALALARLGAMAQECRCDKQGRIPVPQRLIDYAGLKDAVIMVGALTTIQLWSPEKWARYRMADETVLDEIQKISERADSFMDLWKDKI